MFLFMAKNFMVDSWPSTALVLVEAGSARDRAWVNKSKWLDLDSFARFKVQVYKETSRAPYGSSAQYLSASYSLAFLQNCLDPTA